MHSQSATKRQRWSRPFRRLLAGLLLVSAIALLPVPARAQQDTSTQEITRLINIGKALLARGDYVRAYEIFLPLAVSGNAESQTTIGGMYHDGFGADQDYFEAVRWTRLAAKQGHPVAQFNLGDAYYEGTGVPRIIQKPRRGSGWLPNRTTQMPNTISG